MLMKLPNKPHYRWTGRVWRLIDWVHHDRHHYPLFAFPSEPV